MDRAFRAAGFAVDWVAISRFDAPPAERRKLAAPFRDMDAEELAVEGGLVALTKRAKAR